jgi:hypothetical protein
MDHVWLTLDIGNGLEMRASLNTVSRRNREAGFEERIRTGVLISHYDQLPDVGVFEAGGLDYAEHEQRANIFYEYYSQAQMETMFAEKTKRALLVEIWGDIYARHHIGIHQIHSRRASCAVSDDIIGRDGALRFYYAEENACELLLFKFCGQP